MKMRAVAVLTLGCAGAMAIGAEHPAGAVGEAPEAAIGTGAVASDLDQAGPNRDGAGRWHGSTLQLDQSVTTQTLHVGADYQSADPVYELWLAVKPRYYFFETRTHSLNVNLWANLFLELTNSDTTTREREVVLGPTYVSAPYARVLRDRGGYRTVATAGPRVTLPDRAAWDSGQVVGLGATAELSQAVPLRGGGASFLGGARFVAGAIYNHAFTTYTSPNNPDLRVLRQDVDGRPLVSHVLRGSMMVHDALSLTLGASLDVTRRFEVSATYVLLESWLYGTSSDCVRTATGCAAPLDIPEPTTLGVRSWLVAASSYRVSSELSLEAGYYNLANQIGPDGQRRNPFWSPTARFFLTVVAHLDRIASRLGGGGRSVAAGRP